MNEFFNQSSQLIIHQVKEMFEIMVNWETANKYEIKNENNVRVGFAAERTNGIFHRIVRNILRSHRPLTVDLWDNSNLQILSAKRNFYWFFSDLTVFDNQGQRLGEIKTRFGIIRRKYDLLDKNGNLFARIQSPRWRLWTFTIYNQLDQEVGVISKKWGGILKEVFTDSDRFVIDYSKNSWNNEQKATLLFAGLCIDLDFFEDNSNSALDVVP